jgi:hypothetical protein
MWTFSALRTTVATRRYVWVLLRAMCMLVVLGVHLNVVFPIFLYSRRNGWRVCTVLGVCHFKLSEASVKTSLFHTSPARHNVYRVPCDVLVNSFWIMVSMRAMRRCMGV